MQLISGYFVAILEGQVVFFADTLIPSWFKVTMFSLSFSLSGVDNNSYYLVLAEPTSSHPLQATDDQERHYGKVDMDTKYADVNDDNVKSGDIANTLTTIKYDRVLSECECW